MSEIKGSLLTIIMTLVVFSAVFGLVFSAIKGRATAISTEITQIDVSGEPTTK